MELVATTFGGLEQALAAELRALGASKVQLRKRAVAFDGDTRLLYRANLELRTALRVLQPLSRFSIRSKRDLYAATGRIRWDRHMGVDDTLSVDTAVRSTIFRHTQYPGLVVKDAIVDQFRSRCGRRPSVDTRNPTLRIHLHVNRNACTLSLDSSGDSLHRRGYRREGGKAPLSEVLAATVVQLSGWDASRPLVDPMCGSGTMAIEAAMVATRRAPGLVREHFGCQRWPGFDKRLWQQLKDDLEAQQRPAASAIVGSDAAQDAVLAAEANARRAGVADALQFTTVAIDGCTPPGPPGTVLLNPPYGKRLSVADIESLGRRVGESLRTRFGGYEAWVISAEPRFHAALGLECGQTCELDNGGLTCELKSYQLPAS